MRDKNVIRVGIGFATGRKSFQKILKTYVYNFLESGLTQDKRIHLSLLVAYDLKYADTKPADYINIRPGVRDLIDDTYFIGGAALSRGAEPDRRGVLRRGSPALFGCGGYAAAAKYPRHRR
jgi:hypothetical protein